MPNLDETLSNILIQLANFFGTTTEVIMTNAPMWLAKLGWYSTIKDIPLTIFLWVLICSGIALVYFGALMISEQDLSKGKTRTYFLICAIVLVLMITTPLITCAIAPEYVGLEYLLSLINNVEPS